MTNYDLAIHVMMTHFLPPYSLQCQKRYLYRVLFNPCESKICEFLFHINDIAEYLKHSPPFGTSQGFTSEKIIELVEFGLTQIFQKQLIMKLFNLDTKIINNLVELYNKLYMAEVIYGDKVDGTHPKTFKHSGVSRQLASSAKHKGSNHTAKTSVEGA